MKCLSVLQPWAHLILSGQKWVENRTWTTRHRGPLLIHAGRGKTALEAARIAVPTARWTETDLVYGAIVGIVNVVDCWPIDDPRLAQPPYSGWAFGPSCWVLAEPRAFGRPIEWRGRLGLFEVADAVLRRAG